MDPFLQQKMLEEVKSIMQRISNWLGECKELLPSGEQLTKILIQPGAAERLVKYYSLLCQAASCWPEAFEGCRQLVIHRSDCHSLPGSILSSGLRIVQLMKVSRMLLGISSPSLQRHMLKDEARIRECFAGIPSQLLPRTIQMALEVRFTLVSSCN